jgi:hypothetical protein
MVPIAPSPITETQDLIRMKLQIGGEKVQPRNRREAARRREGENGRGGRDSGDPAWPNANSAIIISRGERRKEDKKALPYVIPTFNIPCSIFCCSALSPPLPISPSPALLLRGY